MAGDIRYRTTGDNSVLRSVLYRIWGYKCYWCGNLKDFTDVQIDHIVPQTATSKRLDQLAAELNLSDGFDVHDPRNLAPICSSCNGPKVKGSKDWSDRPVAFTKLDIAMRLRPKVIKAARTFADPSKTAAALILANEADLSNPAARKAFEEHAPTVVQKLALLAETKADFVSFRRVVVQVQVDERNHHPELNVGISLDARHRRAAAILEDVCYGAIEDVVAEPVA